MMIEHQAETINQIETHAENTVADLETGVKDVEKAIVSAKATRTVSLLIYLILLASKSF